MTTERGRAYSASLLPTGHLVVLSASLSPASLSPTVRSQPPAKDARHGSQLLRPHITSTLTTNISTYL